MRKKCTELVDVVTGLFFHSGRCLRFVVADSHSSRSGSGQLAGATSSSKYVGALSCSCFHCTRSDGVAKLPLHRPLVCRSSFTGRTATEHGSSSSRRKCRSWARSTGVCHQKSACSDTAQVATSCFALACQLVHGFWQQFQKKHES